MNPMAVGFGVTLAAVLIGRMIGRYWIIRRYQAGEATPRTAIRWITILTVVPYILLFLFMLLTDPSLWWVTVLLFIASWPVIALPLVAVIYTIEHPRQP